MGPLPVLGLAALGVVYGDIGTSPLYAVRESFSGHFGVAPTPENVLGVLSLIIWSLIIIVSIKYLVLVLRADNEGEGGVLALTALILPRSKDDAERRRNRLLLVYVGLFGAALLYGDAMLTPAISVLSAVEGIQVTAPGISHFVVPCTVAILVLFFFLQNRGTARVGLFFGPIMLVWFAVLAVLGIWGITLAPVVLTSIDPRHAVVFLLHNNIHGLLVLGAVFLVVTGAENLYADMGHFGRRPIRYAWFTIVLPALLLNYLGQSAAILADAETVRSPFYLLAPGWVRPGLVILATLAAVIASQAVVTGVFSLTMQAVQLGYAPRLEVRHTSPLFYGQIYIPQINWALMIATIILVLGFRSSSALTAAYGIAIISTMLVTTLLLFVVAPERWGWPPVLSRIVLSVFLVIELAFFSANVIKIEDGGWVPLAIAASIFIMMRTWRDGRDQLAQRIAERLMPLEKFLHDTDWTSAQRVPGNAIYMTGNPHLTPPPLLMNLEHQKTLHERIVLMTVQNERVPHVSRRARVELENLDHGFHRVVARYGFMQRPDAGEVLTRLRELGLDLPISDTTFFLGRERLVTPRGPFIARWRVHLFSFLVRNSQRATAFFNIPPDRVVEVGSQIELTETL